MSAFFTQVHGWMRRQYVPQPLPAPYRILPHEIPFYIPNFTAPDPSGHVLSVDGRDCAPWYHDFIARLVNARGREFLPVCRLSDGEYLFAVGPQPADIRRPWWQRTISACWRLVQGLKNRGDFAALTRGRYHSGAYTRQEWTAEREHFGRDIQFLGEAGILAVHLNYEKNLFHELFFPAIKRWMQSHQIALTTSNYVPSYFVYAALTGPRRREILAGRVLVVNSASGGKRQRIIAGLHANGAEQVEWCTISERRSLYDIIDVTPYFGRIDIAIVGAGIGKAHIMRQMQPLGVPCIDAGFIFEVWADPDAAFERPFCKPDEVATRPTPPGFP